MNTWIGTLLGIVVSGVVIYILSMFNLQNQERSISATQQRATRQSEMNLIAMVEIDFQNIGSNHPAFDNDPSAAIRMYTGSAPNGEFKFVGQTRRGMPPDTVSYKWNSTGTKVLKRGTVNVFRVQRFVNGKLAGESTGAITRFEIVMLEGDGTVTNVTSDARQIAIGISLVSNLGESALLGETHWESIVRPNALARLDYLKYTGS